MNLSLTPKKGSADYLAINSIGKVPALTHSNAVPTETAAICAYLTDRFPQEKPHSADQRPAPQQLLSQAVIWCGPAGNGAHRQQHELGGAQGKSGFVVFGCYEDTLHALENAL